MLKTGKSRYIFVMQNPNTMKTFRLLLLTIVIGCLWQPANAQQPCASISYMQVGGGDSVWFSTPYIPGATTFELDFGDGQTLATSGFISHTYQAPGEYIACLNVVSPTCTITVCDTVVICGDAFGAMQVVQTPQGGDSTTLSVSGAPTGSTFYWQFGDSTLNSSLETPTYYFPVNDNVTGVVRITTPMGCSRNEVFIINTMTECQAQWNHSAYGKEVTFNAPNNTGTPIYTWYFGDGTTATEQSPVHTYAAFGTYDVCLVVSNTDCIDTVCQSLNVIAPLCPDIDSLYNGSLIASGSFYLQPLPIAGIPDFTLTVDFGDGTSAVYDTAIGIQHTYANAGEYVVCINYTTAYCNVTGCDSVYVDPCPATAVQYEITNDNTLMFSLSATLSGWTYAWSFSEGSPNTLTGDSVFLTINNGGSFTGTVGITAPGCAAPVSIPFTYTVSDSGLCHLDFTTTIINNYVQFNMIGIIGQQNTYYSFDFGDGISSTNPAHTYAGAGTYTVCLTRTSQACTNTVCKPVTIGSDTLHYYGRVYKGGNYACSGVAYLIEEDSAGHLAAIDTFIFGAPDTCYGYFVFSAPAGTYYVKVALKADDADYANYLPTYFGNELSWADATSLAQDIYTSHDINLIAGTNPGGPGFVGGYVDEGAGLGVIGYNDYRGIGDPVANVQVNLLTENDVAVAYTYTDGNGRYTFNNLALGSYKIYAEVLNKTAASQIITLTANNPSQDNVDVLVNSNSAVTGINDIADIKVDGVFPNPVKDMAIIRFTAKLNANATVKVTDMKGSVVSTINANIITGNNELKIDLTNQAAGVYTVSITNYDNKKIIKLLKAN